MSWNKGPTLVAKYFGIENAMPMVAASPFFPPLLRVVSLILLTLDHTRNNKTRAADILGISLKTLYNRLNQWAEERKAG